MWWLYIILSKELATHLTGRYIDFVLFPLSFMEFLDYNKLKLNKNSQYLTRDRSEIYKLFNKYIINSGIFDYYKFGKEILRNIWSSVILKDIVLRYQIKYPVVLEGLSLMLINHFTSKISISNLCNHFNVKSPHTLIEYIKYMENAFLVFTVNKFSYKVKEQLLKNFKVIFYEENKKIRSVLQASNGKIDITKFLISYFIISPPESIFSFVNTRDSSTISLGTFFSASISKCYFN